MKAPQHPDPATVIGGLEITKVVRDFVPIVAVRDGHNTSLGAFLDEHIATLVREGGEVQDVAFHFEREQWQAIAEYYSPVRG